MKTELRSSDPTNVLRVNLLLNFMDLAITCCKSATLSLNGILPESALANAKKSYGDALRIAGTVAFNANQVAEFEWRSVRLETMIGKLQNLQALERKPIATLK